MFDSYIRSCVLTYSGTFVPPYSCTPELPYSVLPYIRTFANLRSPLHRFSVFNLCNLTPEVDKRLQAV